MPDENEVEATTDNDTLTGGAGADTFVFGRDHGDDVITDFTSGEDRIDLSAFAVRSLSDLTITTDESGLTIDLTAQGGGTIRLDGVVLDDLEDSDFIFSHLDGGGTSAADVLQADDDGDRVDGGGGDDHITGGAGSDGIAGHDGDDELLGGEGNDFLVGGAGADTIDGGTGDDEMYGDGGADVFVFAPGHGADFIYDFTDGEDQIDLTGFTGISGFDELTIASGDDGVTIDLTAHGGGTIRLDGFDIANLDADDFLFPVDQTITGDDGDNTITGTTGDDTIEAGRGDDTVYGGDGADKLYGNDGTGTDADGDDTLYGGSDDDSLKGGRSGDPAAVQVSGAGGHQSAG